MRNYSLDVILTRAITTLLWDVSHGESQEKGGPGTSEGEKNPTLRCTQATELIDLAD